MLIRMLALAAFAPLMLLAACGGDDDNATATPKTSQTATPGGATPAPKDIAITAADFSLTPANITAEPGQVITISLNNTGSTKHSFTIGSTDVTEAGAAEATSGVFTASETTVEFHCKYHSTTMKGTITVSNASSSNGLGTIPASASAAPAGISGYGY